MGCTTDKLLPDLVSKYEYCVKVVRAVFVAHFGLYSISTVVRPAAEQSKMYGSGPREYVVRLAIQILEGCCEEMVELVDEASSHSASP